MTKRILKDFYAGNLVPASRKVIQSPEIVSAAQELAKAESQLRTMLAPEALEVLERMKTAHDTLDSLTEESAYLDGFKTGARFITEIFYVPEDNQEYDHMEV